MHAPVDQRAAAGDGLGGEGAAQTGNGAMGAEGDVDVEDLAQLAVVDELLDEVDAVVEAVDHADVQDAAGLVLHLLHLQRLGVGAGGGLFAQNVLAGAHRVDGDGGMHVVGRADGHGLDLGVVQGDVIVGDGRAAAVLLHGGLGALGENIAEILDLRFGIVHVRGNVGGVGDGAAADDGDFHGTCPP